MKANEIMIGDWVSVDGEHIKVESIYEHSHKYRVNDDNICVENCNPIQLTKEMLNINNLTECKAIEGETVGVQTYGFEYVHELQHALRLCGFTEIADNFRLA